MLPSLTLEVDGRIFNLPVTAKRRPGSCRVRLIIFLCLFTFEFCSVVCCFHYSGFFSLGKKGRGYGAVEGLSEDFGGAVKISREK